MQQDSLIENQESLTLSPSTAPKTHGRTLQILHEQQGLLPLHKFIFSDLIKLASKIFFNYLPSVVIVPAITTFIGAMDDAQVGTEAIAFPWMNAWTNSACGIFMILPTLMKKNIAAAKKEPDKAAKTRELQRIGDCYRQGMLFALVVGAFVAVPQFFAEPILEKVFAVNAEVALPAANFARWVSLGIFLNVLASVQQMLINVSEDTALIVLPNILRVGIEVGCTYWLLRCAYAGIPLGLSTYALVMSAQVLFYLTYSTVIISRRRKFTAYQLFNFQRFTVDCRQIGEIFWLGLPVGLRVFVDIASQFIIAGAVERIALVASCSFQSIMQPLSFLLPCARGLEQVLVMRTATLGGESWQSENYIKYYAFYTFTILTLLYGIALPILIFSRHQIVKFFNQSASDSSMDLIQAYTSPLAILALWAEQFFLAMNMNCVGVLRGHKITWRPFLFNLAFILGGVMSASFAQKAQASYEQVVALWAAGLGTATVFMGICLHKNLTPAKQKKTINKWDLWERVFRSKPVVGQQLPLEVSALEGMRA